jgi:hypothetical protein
MSDYTIRIPILVLTTRQKILFLRWALKGFKLSKPPSGGRSPKLPERSRSC